MAAYTVTNNSAGTQQNLGAAFKTMVSASALTGATTLRRGWIMEWEIGADNVPNATDCAIAWSIEVQTVAGTGTTGVANPNDIGGGDAAALLTYVVNFTVEPTIAANQASQLWYMGLNQRASYRVQMRDEWSAIIVPAVTAKGPCIRAKSTNYTSTVGTLILVRE